MKVSSVEEIVANGPGEYQLTYDYNGQKINVNVKVGQVDQNASININGYGSGYMGDAIYYDQYLADHTQNSIDLRLDSGYHGKWDAAMSSLCSDIANAYHIDPSNTMVSGFSMTGHTPITFSTTYAQQTGAKDFTAILIEDCNSVKLTDEQRQTLIDNNVTVLNVYSRNGHSLVTNAAMRQSYEGVHLIDMHFVHSGAGNPHVIPHDVLALNGVTNLGNGSFDFTQLPTEFQVRNKGGTANIDYVITEYYMDNGEYVSRNITLDQMNEILGCGPYYGGVIQSDNEYLGQGLTQINTQITQLSNSVFTLNVSSTTSVPAKEVALLNSLMDAIKDLCEKMRQELVTMGEVGNRFNDLNIKLESEAEALMASFKSPVTSTLLDIPIKDIVNYLRRPHCCRGTSGDIPDRIRLPSTIHA